MDACYVTARMSYLRSICLGEFSEARNCEMVIALDWIAGVRQCRSRFFSRLFPTNSASIATSFAPTSRGTMSAALAALCQDFARRGRAVAGRSKNDQADDPQRRILPAAVRIGEEEPGRAVHRENRAEEVGNHDERGEARP